MRLRIVRQKPHRRRRFGKSFILMAEPSQNDPEALVRLSEFGARANGLAKFASRRLRFALLFENEPQIVVGLFILWIQLGRVRQFRSSAGEILILNQRQPQSEVDYGRVRTKVSGRLKESDGLLQLANLLKRDPQVEGRVRIIRCELNRFAEFLDRRGGLSFLSKGNTLAV